MTTLVLACLFVLTGAALAWGRLSRLSQERRKAEEPAGLHLAPMEQLKRRVATLSKRIGADPEDWPAFDENLDRPHVTWTGHYNFVEAERGVTFARRSTEELDEILFWIFEPVTHRLATQYAIQFGPAGPGEDFRRMLFGRQLALMRRLSPDWEARLRAELDDVLRRAPFSDGGPNTL